jgi:hypothetical protein
MKGNRYRYKIPGISKKMRLNEAIGSDIKTFYRTDLEFFLERERFRHLGLDAYLINLLEKDLWRWSNPTTRPYIIVNDKLYYLYEYPW